MGGKVKQLQNYTIKEVEALFESDENNRIGVNCTLSFNSAEVTAAES